MKINCCVRNFNCDALAALLRLAVGIIAAGFHLAATAEIVITPSIHFYSLDDQSQTILGKNADFGGVNGAENLINGGIQILYRFDNGFAVGGEFEMNRWGYESAEDTSTYDNNEATYRALFIVARKYFAMQSIFKPYVGFGMGQNEVDINGHIDAHLEGRAGQLHAGVAIVEETVGIDLGYKRIQGSSSDVNGGEMNLNGHMLMFGITFKH